MLQLCTNEMSAQLGIIHGDSVARGPKLLSIKIMLLR